MSVFFCVKFGWHLSASVKIDNTVHHSGPKENERSRSDCQLKSAVTHLPIIHSSCFATALGCTTDGPAFCSPNYQKRLPHILALHAARISTCVCSALSFMKTDPYVLNREGNTFLFTALLRPAG